MTQANKKAIKILLIIFLLPIFSFAQTFRYSQYTTHDGLPIDNVYAAAQDGDGFMWFGTDFGIAKFDGYKFINYYKGAGLSNTAVTDLVYAGGDSLLILSYPLTLQAIHYDGRINTIFNHQGFSLQKITKHYNQYYYFQRNAPFVGIYENGKNKYVNTEIFLGIKDAGINAIISLKEKGVAFCTTKGMFVLNNGNIKPYLQNEDVLYINEKIDKSYIAVYGNNIVGIDSNFNFKKLPFSFPSNYRVLHMATEADGTTWFRADDKGIYRLQNNKLEEISDRLGLQNKIVNSFFIDREKNTWFCTDGAGVLFKKKTAFINYETQDGLVNNKVLQLLKAKNKLFIGTSNGLSVKENEKITTIEILKYTKGLKYVFKLFPASNGDASVCISNDYSLTEKENASRFKKIQIENITLNVFQNPITFAWEKSEKEYYISDFGHLKRYKNNLLADSMTFPKGIIQRVYTMATYNNQTWLGTKGGLFKLNNNTFTKIDSIANNKIELVFQLFVDKKNRFWIATENGLFVYENNSYRKIQLGKTLSSNYCKAITEDNEGKIWLATWDGLFVIVGNSVMNYSTAEGLVSKICNSVLFDSSTNKIYIGTDNGLSEIDKNNLIENASFSNVYINCNYDDTLNVLNESKLKSDQNNLNFYFSLPYYQGNGGLQYEYKLDDGMWNTSTTPTIFLSDISTGAHKLYARAKKNGTLFTKENAVFSFNIAKPFYTTWWFWLAVLFASQYLFFKIINHYNKKARENKLKEQQQQAEYASLKQQAFTSLMNPHFIFNSLNSIQHYVNRQDRKSANKYLSDFATLIRKNFDAAQQSFVSLDEELETLRLYLSLEKMRFTDKFDYEIILSPTTEDDEWMLPSMVLQPFLENSIIHGLMPLSTKGLLTIEAFTKNNALHVIITDNGVGIEKSKLYKTNKKHVSRGMQLIKERLEMLSSLGKEPILFTIEPNKLNEENEGTKVSLVFPQSVYEAFQKRPVTTNNLTK